MDNTEYIENYFKGIISDAEKRGFEEKILKDDLFAREVAFYISANDVIQQQLQEQKKQRFKELYLQQKVVSIKQPLINLWKYAAAACVIVAVMVFSWLLYGSKISPQRLADKYMRQNWQNFPVTMGSSQDSLQEGLKILKDKKPAEALAIFESLAKDTENVEAKKYAGIVAVYLQHYDKALQYFSMLEADTSLRSNFGKFYKAITLMKRSKPGDTDAAKLLLRQVIESDGLEGKKEAAQWLEKIK